MLVGKALKLSTAGYIRKNENLIEFLYFIKKRQQSCVQLLFEHRPNGYKIRLTLEPTTQISTVVSILHMTSKYKIVRWVEQKPVVIHLYFERKKI